MFGDDDGKEFIYKEPKITGLAEISHRLEDIYAKKHGRESVKLIMESAKVLARINIIFNLRRLATFKTHVTYYFFL